MRNQLSIGFTGDLSFSGHFRGCETTDVLDETVKAFLASADTTVINMESPITNCRMTKKRRLAHRQTDEVLDFTKKNMPAPVLSLANNHLLDYHYIGLIDTLESIEASGLPYFGAGRNLDEAIRPIIVGDEVKVGMIAFQYKKQNIAGKCYSGTLHESKENEIKRAIEDLKKSCDWVVVVYHGGEEFLNAPMPFTRKQLKRYLKWGADIVVAHHPHTVQGYEKVGDKTIFYSLGNFIFDTDYQRQQENTDEGVLIRIDFSKEEYAFQSLPTKINRETHKVVASTDNQFFVDLKSIAYKKFWRSEAYRKLDIRQRALDLKEREISEREEREAADKDRYEKIMLDAGLMTLEELYFEEHGEEMYGDLGYVEQNEVDTVDGITSTATSDDLSIEEELGANLLSAEGRPESATLNGHERVESSASFEAETSNTDLPKGRRSLYKRFRKFYKKYVVERRTAFNSLTIKRGQILHNLFGSK